MVFADTWIPVESFTPTGQQQKTPIEVLVETYANSMLLPSFK